MKANHFDAIVVGSGMTGGWAAKELTEKGLKTLVLERGRPIEHGVDYVTEHKPLHTFPFRGLGDRREAERDYAEQSTHPTFGETTRHFFINDRLNPYSHGVDKPFSWIRGWQVGGRSLLWTRQCLRLTDLNFEENARQGIGIDWPIRFKDIEPWYDYVEAFIGISAVAGVHESIPTQLLPPLRMNLADKHLCETITRRFPGRVLTSSPQAILTQPRGQRMACHYCGPCERGCSVGAYFSSLSSTLPAARATGRLTLRANSLVHSLIHDGQTNRITGVRVIDTQSHATTEYFARVVFLCASAMESARLLLNSATAALPAGLANSSGLVGHYLMDHITAGGASGIIDGFDQGRRYSNGYSPGMLYMPRFRNVDRAHPGFIRGYHMTGGASLPGWRRGKETPLLGAALKESLRDPGPWRVGLSGCGECLPHFDNHMTLSKGKVDAWGVPVPHFEFTWDDNARAMRADMGVAAAEMLEAAGARDIHIHNGERPPGNDNHEMGGARMGRDPSTSVLNEHNQAHDIPNLFITDGACMTSAANQNPSLTYMALTARACDYAVRQLKAKKI